MGKPNPKSQGAQEITKPYEATPRELKSLSANENRRTASPPRPRMKAAGKAGKAQQLIVRCKGPAVRGKHVCRMHGAFAGAPRGKAHGSYKHGRFTCEAIRSRQLVAALVSLANKGMSDLP